MASLPLIIFISLSLIPYISSNLLLLPVSKDPATHQFTTLIHIHPQPIKLVLDLGGPSLWLHCSSSSSSSLSLLPRRSIQCTRANSDGGAHLSNKTSACYLENRNDFSGLTSTGQLAEGSVAVRLISGSTATVDRFLFSCGSTLMLSGLTSGALGMIGLGGKSQISATAQFAAAFGFRSRRFAACLPRSNGSGVLAFGESPVESVFGTEISRSLLYTPLVAGISSPTGYDYFVNLKSIRIDGEKVSVNRDRIGLAKLSTTVPYTLMESWLYRMFREAYLKAAAANNMKRVKPVSPFGLCFVRSSVNQSIPVIDLGLQSEMVKWMIQGRNSMVPVKGEEGEVMCLGILEGGNEMEAAVVIGGLEMEDRVMEFDLDGSRLGFSSPMKQRTCSDFVPESFGAAESS
ncbi:Probable aspartic proteinase GIP2 [Linum grandiflorum]